MNVKLLITRLGPVGILILMFLLGCSWYLLLVRTMWLYGSPVMWWLYQVAHLVLFLGAIFYFLIFSKNKIYVAFLASILIGFMPYGLWLSMIVNFNANELSDFTAGFPVFLRVIFELGFYPAIQFLLLLAAQLTISRKQQNQG